MCISPSLLAGGVMVGCRWCWQCRSNRVQDWVGRNIAETETATVSYAVTLTYGRSWDGRADHLRAVVLTVSDIQKMLKRMRKAGMLVRYIVAGEYGSDLRRAHWHGVFHFYGSVLPETWDGAHLEWSADQWDRVGGIHIPEWIDPADGDRPLGHVHIRKATYAHTRYALKYLLKDTGDDKSQTKLLMSRKPALGWAYFTQMARETAEAGIAPQDLTYRFRVRMASGEERLMEFLLTGKMAEVYLAEYISHWRSLYGDAPRPHSELVNTFEEFGRVGDEDKLTQTRVEKLPGPNSIFRGDGTLKVEQANRSWAEHLRQSGPSHIIRTRGEFLETWMVTNGEAWKSEADKQQFIEQYWREAERDAVAASGLDAETAARFLDSLDAHARHKYISRPLGPQSLSTLRRWKRLQG